MTRLTLQPQPGGTHAVLVASGDDDVRRLLWDTFQDDRLRYRVHVEDTEDGAVALAAISRPALVVLDSSLREGHGVSACRRLREGHQTRGCRIVLISGHATPEQRQLALEAGADTFLAKPFSPLRLIALAGVAVETGPDDAEDAEDAGGLRALAG